MKKFIYRFAGVAIILLCGVSATICTLFDAAVILNLLLGYDVDDVTMCMLLNLPVLIFFWYAWNTSENIWSIRRLLFYPNYESDFDQWLKENENEKD